MILVSTQKIKADISGLYNKKRRAACCQAARKNKSYNY